MKSSERAAFLVLLAALGCRGEQAGPADPGGVRLARGVVAGYHAESTRAGIEILAAGGNAFDAFVAATFVDYVVSPGVTSPSGPLAVLVYVAAEGQLRHLDGDFNELIDPDAQWDGDEATAGRAALVPGAVAALAELSARYGALPLARVLEPAIRIAREGFVVDWIYAGTIAFSEDSLRRSAYGTETFFPDGGPVREGARLKLPVLADFLQALADQGPAHVYAGAWTDLAIAAAAQRGGGLTAEDFARYQAVWREPRRTTYRGYEVAAPAGRVYAGLWALVGLETLEHTHLAPLGHYGEDADALELMVRLTRVLHGEPWFFDPGELDDGAAVARRLAEPYTGSLWDRLRGELAFAPPLAALGSHSYHLIAADAEGNIVTGTNTLEGVPFGDGVFVQGVALNAAGRLLAYHTAAGERRLSPFSVHIVLADARPRAATGAFGSSLIETELEMLVDLLEYQRPGAEVAASKRFGTFADDPATGELDFSANWLDGRVSPGIVAELARRGLRFDQRPEGDVGFGVALTIEDGGEPSASALPTYGHPVSVEVHPPRE